MTRPDFDWKGEPIESEAAEKARLGSPIPVRPMHRGYYIPWSGKAQQFTVIMPRSSVKQPRTFMDIIEEL